MTIMSGILTGLIKRLLLVASSLLGLFSVIVIHSILGSTITSNFLLAFALLLLTYPTYRLYLSARRANLTLSQKDFLSREIAINPRSTFAAMLDGILLTLVFMPPLLALVNILLGVFFYAVGNGQ